MRSIGHFIGGKEVKGTSGRTADVFEPMTGDVQAKVALAERNSETTIIGQSPAIRRVLHMVETVGASEVPTLVTGESDQGLCMLTGRLDFLTG